MYPRFTMNIGWKKELMILFIAGSICILLKSEALAQQDTTGVENDYMDEKDLMMVIRGKNTEKLGAEIPLKGKLMLFIVPIIGSNPNLGAFYGIGGTGAIYLGDPETTSISNLNTSILHTTKNQFVTSLRGTIMTRGNSWEMLVDFKYADFSENTYGLGSDDAQLVKESWNIGGVQTAEFNGAQAMTFNQLKLHFTALKNIGNQIYVGAGYHLDYHYNIKDLELDLEAPNPVITSHYAYSIHYDYDPDKYVSSGLSLNFVYDSRDHTVNPYRGKYFQATYRPNMSFLGNRHSNQQVYLESRLYYPLSKKMPRHLLGFWFIGHFTIAGDVPYLHLPASAYDMRNRIGRGYVIGRFRGPSWLTAESEYRFPISRNGLFGGVLFGSLTTTSRSAYEIEGKTSDRLYLFEAIRPAGGFGARIMLNRTGRLNIGVDLAFGQDGSKGLYINVGETF